MPCLRVNSSLAVSIPGQCPLEKPLDPCVAEYSVTGRTRHETCMRHLQALFQDVVKNTGRVKTSANRYNTGKTKSNPWVFDQRTISRGLEKRGSPIT